MIVQNLIGHLLQRNVNRRAHGNVTCGIVLRPLKRRRSKQMDARVGHYTVEQYRRAVPRILKRHGILCRKRYKGLQLEPNDRRYRVQWVLKRRNQRQNQDPLSVYDRIRIYGRVHDRLVDNCVLERDRFGGGSVIL